jgi:hypothetical protein
MLKLKFEKALLCLVSGCGYLTSRVWSSCHDLVSRLMCIICVIINDVLFGLLIIMNFANLARNVIVMTRGDVPFAGHYSV